MSGEENRKKRFWVTFKDVVSVLADVAILSGIILALFQLYYSAQRSKTQIAVEAVQAVGTKDFLDAFSRVKGVREKLERNAPLDQALKEMYGAHENHRNSDLLIGDLNQILAFFRTCWDLIQDDVVNKSVIIRAVKAELGEFSEIVGLLKRPPVSLQNKTVQLEKFAAYVEKNSKE